MLRGWFFNQDRDSSNFDLKFSLAASDIDFNALNEDQMTNHFKCSTCLTTKVGLLHTLRNCHFFGNHHSDMYDFFPRSYSLSYPQDLQGFLDDYFCLQAVASLQKLLEKYQVNKHTIINIGVLNILIGVVNKCTYIINDAFLNSTGFIEEQCFSSIQSTIIQYADEWLYQEVTSDYLNESNNSLEEIKHLLMEKRKKENDEDETKKERKRSLRLLSKVDEMNDYHETLINSILDRYRSLNSSQCHINGKFAENIWILKPAGKSRGRGISVVQSLDDIVAHMIKESDSRSRLNQWVIQKYIENPLVVSKRKFDIRQWVMVKGKNYEL